MSRFLLICILLISNIAAFSQFVEFTQYYGSSLRIAPSFAGADEKLRFSMNQKKTDRLDGFITNYFATDWNAPRLKSGFGFSILRGELAQGIMYDTRFEGLYAFNARIGKKWFFRPGISFSFTTNTIKFTETIFSDQLESHFSNSNIPLEGSTSLYDFNEYENLTYGDLKVSFVFHNENLRFGALIDHLRKPNVSYSLTQSKMHRTYAIFGDYDLNLQKKQDEFSFTHFSATWIAYSQNSVRSMNAALYWHLPYIAVGLGANGIPLMKNEAEMRRGLDGMAMLFLVNFKSLRMGYNYDFSFKRPVSFHEVSLQFNIDMLFPDEE